MNHKQFPQQNNPPHSSSSRDHLDVTQILAESEDLETRVAAVAFSDTAHFILKPTLVEQAPYIGLSAGCFTNEMAGLELVRYAWEQVGLGARLNVVVMGDGLPTKPECNPKKQAENAAERLRREGAQIATVAFDVCGSAQEHLMRMASSPYMFIQADKV